MIKIIKYLINLLLLIFISLATNACNEDPPIVPEPDPVMGCKVGGDITVDYKSGKGFIGVLQSNPYQYYFSSYKVIDGKEYGLIVSLFPKNPADTNGYFPIVAQENAPSSGNYAIAAFVVDNELPTELQFWATGGDLNISYVSLGKGNNKIIGSFSFNATDRVTKQKKVTVIDGWVDLVKQL